MRARGAELAASDSPIIASHVELNLAGCDLAIENPALRRIRAGNEGKNQELFVSPIREQLAAIEKCNQQQEALGKLETEHPDNRPGLRSNQFIFCLRSMLLTDGRIRSADLMIQGGTNVGEDGVE